MSQQYGLGRGLASLIPPKKIGANEASPQAMQAVPALKGMGLTPTTHSHPEVPLTQEVPVGEIVPNPHQPRLHFDEAKLAELAESIRVHGILQPLIVTKTEKGYELIAGERRLQAAKRAGLTTVPVVVKEVGTNQAKLELAIIENIQRHDLNPIEEAKAYLRLAEEFNLPQEEVAKKMGKSRSTVANTTRLLTLPVEIQRAVMEGKLSEGHAKALLAVDNPEKQRALFELIIKEELTVRETEEKARSVAVRSHIRTAREQAPEIVAKEEWLTEQLGTKVKIQSKGKGGKILIEYYSGEELNTLLGRIA